MSKNKNNKVRKESAKDSNASVSPPEPVDWNWEPVPSDGVVKKLGVGESIFGKLLEVGQSNKYSTAIYKLQEPKAEVQTVILGTAILSRQMDQIPVGAWVKIERLPDKSTDKGNPMQDYRVFTRKENSDGE